VTYLIPLVALFGLMWLLLIRPQRKRSQTQVQMQDLLRAGDEIITAGGLHAIVRSIEDDVLEIELAPGTIVRLDRRAVAAAVNPQPDVVEQDMAEEPAPPDDG
jgi:preprotein translocase subunit YajC